MDVAEDRQHFGEELLDFCFALNAAVGDGLADGLARDVFLNQIELLVFNEVIKQAGHLTVAAQASHHSSFALKTPLDALACKGDWGRC